MRIIVEQGEIVYYDQEISKGTYYIGRHDQCQIKLPGNDQIAPRHVMIFEENGSWFVTPLHNQFHMTKLNGQQLQSKRKLMDGYELTIGDFRIKCHQKDTTFYCEIQAKSIDDLQATNNYQIKDMNLPDSVVIKSRNDTFSLSKGYQEHLLTLARRMIDSLDLRSLLSAMVEMLLNDLQASCVWIGLRTNNEGELALSAGRNLLGRTIDIPPTAQRFSFATVECGRAMLQSCMEDDPERTCICCPLIGPQGSLGMVYLESNPLTIRYNLNHLDNLFFICNHLAMAIDHLMQKEQQKSQQIRALNQELAKKVQSCIASWQVPQWPELQLAVLSEPGTGPCTDFYDIVPLGEKQAMILIGHAFSESSDTAVCIAQMISAFRIGAIHRDHLHVLMRQINWLMNATAPEPRRISTGVLAINPETGEYSYCAAGDIYAYLLGMSGKVVKIQNSPNPLVGESRKSKYETVSGKLATEQLMVLCTHGIYSVVSDQKAPFDENHLWDVLADNRDQPPARIITELAEDIGGFTGGKRTVNAVTLLVLRKGKPAHACIIGPPSAPKSDKPYNS